MSLFYRKNIYLLIALIVTACNKPAEYQLNNFELTLTFLLNYDTGLDGGTLFEAYDADGNLLAYAGFNNGVNTRSSSNRKNISFYVKPLKDTFSLKDVGNPFPGIDECGRIFNVNNELWALNYKHEKKKLNPYTLKWEDIKEINWKSNEYLIDIQKLQDSIIWVYTDGIFWGNKTLYCENISNYKIIAFCINSNQFFIFRSATNDSLKNLISVGELIWIKNQCYLKVDTTYTSIGKNPISDGAYCWEFYNGKFYLSTNEGNTYMFDKNSFKIITNSNKRKIDDWGWQVYSTLKFKNKLLIGHYPSGNIYEVKNNKIRLPTKIKEIPIKDKLSDSEREAQSMAIYAGYLMCGLWPWGELNGFDLNKNKWTFYKRVFEYPQLSKENAPFVNRFFYKTGKINNQWGQRIQDLVNYNQYLAINTSFKNVISANDKRYIFPYEEEQYGKVYLLEIPGQISNVIN